jgi:hypothetical protein
VNCPRPPGRRWRAGTAPTWPAPQSTPASPRRSRTPRSGAGCQPTRSSHGGTAPGSSHATPTSPSRPPACSTCTPAASTAKPLRDGDYVVSADEKTSIQARARKHPTQPPASGQPTRVEHEYARRGALAYLAAWDVGRAKVFGRCEPTSGIDPFMRLVNDVMTTEPYASARRVFWVVDNGSSHRGTASVKRLRKAHDNARLVHLPVHASWLNQVEIYFSVIQRKVLTPNDFADLDAVEARLLAFQDHYAQIANPFEWKFTTADLRTLLARSADHDYQTLAPAA